MRFQFVGCGDAFGSGGRFNTCFHVIGNDANFLIDCGATSLVALKRGHVVLNDIRTILITHFHADHFGGVPGFVLEAQLFSKRSGPLRVVGPPGLRTAFAAATENAYPGSSKAALRFELDFIEIAAGETLGIDGLEVTAYPVRHGEPEGIFLAYRIVAEGRTIAYSGDTEWVDSLIDASRDADLFVVEAYFRSKHIPMHMDLASLEERAGEISARRIVLTHLSQDMLERQDESPFPCAEDGLIIEL